MSLLRAAALCVLCLVGARGASADPAAPPETSAPTAPEQAAQSAADPAAEKPDPAAEKPDQAVEKPEQAVEPPEQAAEAPAAERGKGELRLILLEATPPVFADADFGAARYPDACEPMDVDGAAFALQCRAEIGAFAFEIPGFEPVSVGETVKALQPTELLFSGPLVLVDPLAPEQDAPSALGSDWLALTSEAEMSKRFAAALAPVAGVAECTALAPLSFQELVGAEAIERHPPCFALPIEAGAAPGSARVTGCLNADAQGGLRDGACVLKRGAEATLKLDYGADEATSWEPAEIPAGALEGRLDLGRWARPVSPLPEAEDGFVTFSDAAAEGAGSAVKLAYKVLDFQYYCEDRDPCCDRYEFFQPGVAFAGDLPTPAEAGCSAPPTGIQVRMQLRPSSGAEFDKYQPATRIRRAFGATPLAASFFLRNSAPPPLVQTVVAPPTAPAPARKAETETPTESGAQAEPEGTEPVPAGPPLPRPRPTPEEFAAAKARREAAAAAAAAEAKAPSNVATIVVSSSDGFASQGAAATLKQRLRSWLAEFDIAGFSGRLDVVLVQNDGTLEKILSLGQETPRPNAQALQALTDRLQFLGRDVEPVADLERIVAELAERGEVVGPILYIVEGRLSLWRERDRVRLAAIPAPELTVATIGACGNWTIDEREIGCFELAYRETGAVMDEAFAAFGAQLSAAKGREKPDDKAASE